MEPGEDFVEQVVVGTPGKVKGMLRDFVHQRKPYINPAQCRVLVFDEADVMVSNPPDGFSPDCIEIRDAIMRARRGKPVQLLLFSATFSDAVRDISYTFSF